MTTASLSGLLTRVGSLTDADVRELEKLADSYPYCQTAHLLLAKALHDRGSVLAGQKLRRAATGAPDRRALRRLLLLVPAEAPPEVVPETSETAPALAVSAAGELVSHEAEARTGLAAAEAPALPAPEPAESEGSADSAEVVGPAATSPPEAPSSEAPAAEAAPEVVTSSAEASAAEAAPEMIPATEVLPATATFALTAAEVAAEAPAAAPVDVPEASAAPAEALTEPAADSPAANTTPAPTTVLADFDLVPDTSPAAVELLLFEADEDAAPAGLSLLTVEGASPASPPLPALAPDPAVAYWLPSSRLGVELTAADFAPTSADGVSDSPPAAELAQAWLPTAPPDARWTAHVAAHQPPAPPPAERRPFDHQFALIDRFLREKPRLRAIDPTRPLPEKLPDLAQKSTRADEGVVSESMARILARQGKTARAVAMYEQLQARLPEKAAIFATQIATLRNSAAGS